ncbi:MAG: LamG domain-containing protein [Candidatus Aenigmarchaeota archaeon]|nr:LamG domain-containing protein [Candidatus Aenigmarchaeota archaeon]
MELKGITPVIALVMLMLITVGIVGASATWFSGTFTSQTKKFVLNNGDTAITALDIIVAQVDGVDVKGTPFFGDMKSGLVGWWNFGEQSGGVAFDKSGSVPPNDASLKPLCPNCPNWVNGKSGVALNFDGSDDYVDAGGADSIDSITGDLTITAWVKATTGTSDGEIVSTRQGKNDFTRPYSLVTFSNGVILSSPGIRFGNGIAQFTAQGGTIPVGEWHFMAGTISGTSISFYLDGVLKGTSPFSGTRQTGTKVTIGSASTTAGDRNFNGIIDEVKIYNKAVGDVNIQPSGSGLVINYPGMEGKHTIKIGTSSGVAETAVTCA